MRRKDKEIIDKETLEEIIMRADICRIALSVDDMPYIVPMNFGYKDSCLYFHSFKEGKKIDFLKRNPNTCFEIDCDVEIIESEIPCARYQI